MYTYNRIHNDFDTNVVRVELNSSPPYRPRTNSTTVISSRAVSREPQKITSSTTAAVNRSDTFTKHEKPPNYQHRSGLNGHLGIVRSETFVVKYHDDYSDEHQENGHKEQGYDDGGGDNGDFDFEKADYGTYTRSSSKKKSLNNGASEKDDDLNYATYTRKEKEKRRGIFLLRYLTDDKENRDSIVDHSE